MAQSDIASLRIPRLKPSSTDLTAYPRLPERARDRPGVLSELHHQAVAAPGGELELVVEYRDDALTVHAPGYPA